MGFHISSKYANTSLHMLLPNQCFNSQCIYVVENNFLPYNQRSI